jgi:hypothetical protein
MHHEHAMDISTMMESGAITTSRDKTMEILPENANFHPLFVLIYFPNHSKVKWFFIFLSFLPILLNKQFTMFLPPASRFNPVTYPSTNKPYPPAILVKNPTWFLKDADLFICHDHILYGVHLSNFNQSPLFREIILYGESNKIGTNPYRPIPFDTLIKEVFHNFLYLLYFRTDHLDHLAPEDWLNVKWLSTDWYFAWITAHIIWKLVAIWRWLDPPPLWMMGNSLPVYWVFDKQEQLSRRICEHIIIVEESSEEEDTIVEDNNA